jgi:DNA-binding NarL/FixJ family response regulator
MKTSTTSRIPEYEHSLSTHERAVLQLVVNGYAIWEIENLLAISPMVIESHLQTLFKKFKVNSMLQLVRLAFENQLVD